MSRETPFWGCSRKQWRVCLKIYIYIIFLFQSQTCTILVLIISFRFSTKHLTCMLRWFNTVQYICSTHNKMIVYSKRFHFSIHRFTVLLFLAIWNSVCFINFLEWLEWLHDANEWSGFVLMMLMPQNVDYTWATCLTVTNWCVVPWWMCRDVHISFNKLMLQ